MKIKFYGVRGSYAVPGETTNKYGGNTTCVTFTNEIDGRIDRVIIDCGTGAVQLGKDIVSNFFTKKEDMNIVMLFTHLHPDHTQGFPFFAPNYFPNCKIDLYGMETLKKNVGRVLESSMLPPTFPIEYKDLKSQRTHHIIKESNKILSPLKTMEIEVMQAYAPSHPQQGALYFKVTDNSSIRFITNKKSTKQAEALRKSVACIWDNESKTDGDMAVIKFSKDCDIMIHDTQYTKQEYMDDKMIVQGFGHSTYDMAIENAFKAGIKDKLICTHFNPNHSDHSLDLINLSLNDITSYAFSFKPVLAQEGMEIDV